MAVWVAWIAAVVISGVVLLFCLYEIRWKAVRLQRDMQALRTSIDEANQLATEVTEIQARLLAAAAKTTARPSSP